MTSFKTLAAAALLAMTASTAMAAVAGGGGGGPAGGGDAGTFGSYDGSIASIQLPPTPQMAPQTQPGEGSNCRYEFFRGHFCETLTRR